MDTTLGTQANSKKQLVIAIATTANQADQALGGATAGFVRVFDNWAVTSWARPGITAQVGNVTA